MSVERAPQAMNLEDLPITDPPSTTHVGRRILAAANELFYRNGITATGVDLICERANTTKRTLYQRFGSKDGLIAAYLTDRAHTWQSRLIAALNPVALSHVSLETAAPGTADLAGAADLLDVVFDEAENWARANPRGCAFVNAWGELADHNGAAAQVIKNEKAWMRSLFAAIVQSSDRALAVHQIYEGAQVCATVEGSLAPFARARSTCRLVMQQA